MTTMRNSFRTALAALLSLVPASRAADWELRGFFGTDTAPEVSLRESSSGRSRWISRGEFDGEIYVESVDVERGRAIVYAGSSRIELRLAAPSGPDAGDRAPVPGSPSESGEREPTEAADVFRISVAEGMRRLRTEHPEYFEGALDADDLAALRRERRRIMADAEAAVRAAE